jgi:hypothetical protein
MDVISISTNAFLSDMLCNHWETLPLSVLRHISRVVDYESIPDRVVADNERVRDIIRWDRLDKMKLIRILIRCIDQNVNDLEKIKKSLQQYEYRVKDLTFLFMRRPEFIEFFPIDLNEVDTVDAAMLLSFGSNYFLDKIDLSRHNFNFRESMNIVKAYNFDRNILENVNYKSLKGYQVSEILVNTGERDLDILDISTLTNIDWINLLEVRPEMLKYCNYSKFMSGDIYYSIKLCCMFDSPDLSHLILDRGVDSISPLGWEILLIEKPEIFLAHCNFSKLDDSNWNYILKSRPELISFKPQSSAD